MNIGVESCRRWYALLCRSLQKMMNSVEVISSSTSIQLVYFSIAECIERRMRVNVIYGHPELIIQVGQADQLRVNSPLEVLHSAFSLGIISHRSGCTSSWPARRDVKNQQFLLSIIIDYYLSLIDYNRLKSDK